MFDTILAEWKGIVLAIAIAVWTFGTWHIAAGYTDNKFAQEKIAMQQKVISDAERDKNLSDAITSSVLSGLAGSTEKINQATKDAVNAMLQDPVFKSCVTPDSVRNAYKRAIAAQQTKQ